MTADDHTDPTGPLATATADLVAWLTRAAGVEVTVRAPAPFGSPDPGGGTLSVWPLELGPDPLTRGVAQRAPIRLRLRCLVSATNWHGSDPHPTGPHPTGPPGIDSRPIDPDSTESSAAGAPPAVHPSAFTALDRVLVAATEAGEPTIVFEPLPAQVWLAFGVAPRPVLLIDLPLRIERPSPVATLVRQPLRVTSAFTRSLRGQVVGPDGVGLAGMRVEVSDTGACVYTDSAGRFGFTSLPATGPARLRLQGRGRQMSAEVGADSTDPVVIHCDIEES